MFSLQDIVISHSFIFLILLKFCESFLIMLCFLSIILALRIITLLMLYMSCEDVQEQEADV